MPLTSCQFAERWRRASLSERSGAQSHFIDLCEVLGEPHPAAVDAISERFTFEKSVSRTSGGKGFADVWLRDHFAWEYKGKHKNLASAYKQLNEYREDLLNPPLLVVCDMNCFEVHTNFGKTKKRIYKFELEELVANRATASCPLPPFEVLQALFHDTDRLRPERTDAIVTQEAAKVFARLAERLEIEKHSESATPIATKEEISHFLLRLLFCLFADSIGLLPNHIFRRLIDSDDRFTPRVFLRKLRNLFRAMAEPEGIFGEHTIKYFNGGLFDSASVIDLDKTDLALLHEVTTRYDWSHVAPAIFGTLFERSLDPSRRSLVGAHYTSEADILLLVEPVVIAPIKTRWEHTKASVLTAKSRLESEDILAEFFEYISSIRVLDPACGSGNFLYVVLRKLLDIWLDARDFAAHQNFPIAMQFAADNMISPSQLLGIEVEYYAHELASVVVWIGFLQWKIEHGLLINRQPVLQRLTNIECADAILRYDEQGKRPHEPAWPMADFIIGNPPFLGGNRIRRELGQHYVTDLFAVYADRLPASSDLVCYWFEKARQQIQVHPTLRAGLLATQAIRGGANRAVLERIKDTGDIFFAYSDRKWILDGAAVHVSMVGFDGGQETVRTLNGAKVDGVQPDLTSLGLDFTGIRPLRENGKLCFMGPSPKAPFDISREMARKMLAQPPNVNGLRNDLVVKRVLSAVDIGGRGRDRFTIDFGARSYAEAAKFEMPFEYVSRVVKPVRTTGMKAAYGKDWWLYGRPRVEMRRALVGLRRYIATPAVSKHRLFVWVPAEVLSNQGTLVFASDSDYVFGVLHSSVHEAWARRTGTQLREAESGFRYTPTSTFSTYAFPWPPGTEPAESGSLIVRNIAEAARELVRLRDEWIDPADASERDTKSRTLTNLYNKRPTWLEIAHQTLDRAVFAAYGLAYPLSQSEILRFLLDLNGERAAGRVRALSAELPPKKAPGVERLPRRKHTLKTGSS